MKKYLLYVTKASLIILLFLAFFGANAQRRYSPLANTDVRMTMNNDVQTSSKTLEFDLYLLDTDNTNVFEMATCQAGITMSSGIYNGGTISIAIIAGTSELLTSQQPAAVNWVASQNCLKLTPRTPPGAGFGTTIGTTGLGTKICRLRITNTNDFTANSHANLTFSFTTVPYPTKVNEYISGVNTGITMTTATAYSQLANVPLNGVSPPVAYTVTSSGSNPYCEGGAMPSVALANSQTGVNYQLYKNTVASGSTVPGTDGTLLFWANQSAGTYTITGTNGGGTTTMSGSIVVTMNPLPGAASPITGSGTVVHGQVGVPFSQGVISDAASYQWAYSGNGATINNNGSSSITIDFDPSATPGNLTVYGLNPCGMGAISANFPITFTSASHTWTGNVDDHWDLATNWNPNSVPWADEDITIPVVARNPEVYTATATCKAAEVFNGMHIQIAPGAALTVNQTLTLDGGTNLLIMDNGSFIDNGITGPGTAEVDKSLTATNYHYISSPISNCLSGAFSGDWLITYSAQYANGWLSSNFIINPAVTLVPEQGYASYIKPGFTSIVMNGNLNSNAPAIACIPQSIPSAGIGFNLVGNAYPSSIDLGNGAISWPSASHTAYFWDPINATYKIYTTVSPSHSQYVPPVQGFFIEAPVNGNFQVPNSARLHYAETFLKDAVVYPNVLNLIATSQANSKVDQAVVGFVPETTTGYDFNYDAIKLDGGSTTPQIFSVLSDNMKVAYNIQPFVTENTVVQMGFTCGETGNYTLTATNLESFDASCRIYLEDLKEGMIQDIKSYPAYNFNYTTGEAANRFVLHFSNPLGINDQQANGVQVYTFESSLYIKNLGNKALKNVFVYDLLGKEVFRSALSQNPLQKFVTTLNQGYYLVKVVSDNGVTTRKVYIN